MAIAICNRCGNYIDIDQFPEAYREELDDECVCDLCWQKIEDEDINHSVNSRPDGYGLLPDGVGE